ncbi:secreted complement binding protein C3b-C4b [Hypsugopox virus]|nr:secreted complement binding protein C3b-C4b [Hypsugopox virus]
MNLIIYFIVLFNYVKCNPCSFCLSDKIVTSNMKPVSPLNDVYFNGDSVEFTCTNGYTSYNKKIITTCKHNKWSSFTFICKPKSCPRPLEPINGYIDEYEGNNFGNKITYSCNDGYSLIGHSSNKCIVNENNKANWEFETPICVQSFCKIPIAPYNGYYLPYLDEYKDNSVITYMCNFKYSLVGSLQNICHNSEWSNNVPKCVIVNCPYPYIKNGVLVTVGKKFTYGDKITYYCKNGYISDTVSICDENSKWVPPLPTCIE